MRIHVQRFLFFFFFCFLSIQVFVGALSPEFEALSIEALKGTTADEMVCCIVDKLQLPLPVESYELAEVVGNAVGQECKERRLAPHEMPVALMLLWPKVSPSRDMETASALAALAAHKKLLQRSISRSVSTSFNELFFFFIAF